MKDQAAPKNILTMSQFEKMNFDAHEVKYHIKNIGFLTALLGLGLMYIPMFAAFQPLPIVTGTLVIIGSVAFIYFGCQRINRNVAARKEEWRQRVEGFAAIEG